MAESTAFESLISRKAAKAQSAYVLRVLASLRETNKTLRAKS